MHIAAVVADIFPEKLGGAEVHFVEVVKRLAKKGHTVELFVGPDSRIANIFPHDISVYTVKYPKIPNFYGLSYILFTPLQIFRKLQKTKIDAIWAKQVFPQGIVAAILARLLKKPLYITAQNPLDYKEELVIKGPIPFKHVWPNLLTPLVSFALRNADVVACVSRYAQEQAKKLGARRTVLIPNGVNSNEFKINNEKLQIGKRCRIVTTSALIPRNALDTLIDAVALLPKSLNWELVIAGEGPLYKNLKLQISNNKLEKKVKLLGRVENSKIPELLGSSAVFVRLSRKEGFGVSFLEAMAAGLPVIATPVGGITDFIKDGETGLLVESEHPQQAANAILRVLNDAALYQQLQDNGRKLVEKRYNWERIIDEVENVFTSIT